MSFIKFEKTLDKPITGLPELDGMVGKHVTVTVETTDLPPAPVRRTPRQGGWAKGEIWMAPDFDKTPDEFKDYL